MFGIGALSALTAVIAFAGSHIFFRYALKRQLIDIPNHRSSHEEPTPRGGGLAIVAAFYVGAVGALLLNYIEINLFVALLSGLVIAGVGYADDRKSLSSRARLAYHFVAALIAIGWLNTWSVLDLGFTDLHWGMVGSIVAVFGLVWLTNLFNFMDGIDGIAASEAIFVSLAIAAFAFVPAAPLLCAAATAGFLCLNWPPARLFMGDVGSGFLGFIIGVIALNAITHRAVSPWPLLILVGLFVTDATFTLVRRALRGEKVWLAHRTHAYQWASRHFRSHRVVLVGAITFNVVWLLPCASIAKAFPQWALIITLIAYIPLLVLAWQFRAGLAEKTNA